MLYSFKLSKNKCCYTCCSLSHRTLSDPLRGQIPTPPANQRKATHVEGPSPASFLLEPCTAFYQRTYHFSIHVGAHIWTVFQHQKSTLKSVHGCVCNTYTYIHFYIHVHTCMQIYTYPVYPQITEFRIPKIQHRAIITGAN